MRSKDLADAGPIRLPRLVRRPAATVLLILLAAVNLRTAVTSVGPLLDTLQLSIGLDPAEAGVLTTLPVLAFAGLGALTPKLARRYGEQRVLTAALTCMTFGLAGRALVHTSWGFLGLSVPALAGGATGNVLLPVVVKRSFPTRIGSMTAAYTTVMAVGTTLAAAVSVPIARLPGHLDWRLGLGVWAVPAALAAACWTPRAVTERRSATRATPHNTISLWRSPTAWALAALFAAQSVQAYVAFGWFAQYFQDLGASATHAGLLVALLSAVQIPISLLIPTITARLSSQRGLVLFLSACYMAAYLGMVLAPHHGDWVWVTLAGIGGGAFPLVLTLIGLRSRTPTATRALSAFTQSVGYLAAGGGPLLVGVLHDLFGGWAGMFTVLFVALAVIVGAGMVVSTPRWVEDEIPATGKVEYPPPDPGTLPTRQPSLPTAPPESGDVGSAKKG